MTGGGMRVLEDRKEIGLDRLLEEVRNLKWQGFRLVTTTCLQAGESLQVLYHFDREYHMRHLQVLVSPGQTVPSISGIYFGAFLAENEMKDQFGLNVTGLPIDYQGRLFLSEQAPVAPMLKVMRDGEDVE